MISELQHKINEQAALLNQFNIDEVEINSGKKPDQRSSTIEITSSLSMGNRRNFTKSGIKDRASYTISFREISSKKDKITRNLSGSSTFINTKIVEESSDNLKD